MLTKDDKKQTKFEMVTIESLVDKDHILRKLEKYIDFSFIYEKVTPQYCKQQPECTRSKKAAKIITRHVWEDAKEWVRENRLSDYGKKLYKKRSETIERSFADAKELYGLRYARFRGLAKVTEQCLLTAACQNMKKIALALWKRDRAKGIFIFVWNFYFLDTSQSKEKTWPNLRPRLSAI